MRIVNEINIENFIEFLRDRPRLKVFHYDETTFKDDTQNICEAISEYCGNEIRDYEELSFDLKEEPLQKTYDFISGFKNLKRVHL